MKELDDGGVADSVAEEEVLDGGGPDHPQERDGEQETSESGWLSGKLVSYVVAENALGLILKHFYRMNLRKASCFWKESNKWSKIKIKDV